MTRNYKDYKIVVNEIDNPIYGKGYRAEFFVPKDNGMKDNIAVYEDYGHRLKPGDIIAFCQKIIDLQ